MSTNDPETQKTTGLEWSAFELDGDALFYDPENENAWFQIDCKHLMEVRE